MEKLDYQNGNFTHSKPSILLYLTKIMSLEDRWCEYDLNQPQIHEIKMVCAGLILTLSDKKCYHLLLVMNTIIFYMLD